MSAAIATPELETPRSGREALFANQGGLLEQDLNKNQPRYFVQTGWHLLDVASPAIHQSRLWRCEIMPCRTVALPEHRHSIAETMRVPGSDYAGPDGKVALTMYRRYAWDEAERLLMMDDASATLGRQNGLTELKSLYSDLGNRLYREINLTQLFFPAWPVLPEKNTDLLGELAERIKWIESNPPAEIPANMVNFALPVLLETGEELRQSVQRIHDLMSAELMATHIKMKQPRNTENFKAGYDSRDLEILKRTGLPKFDSADVNTANALELIAKNNSGDAILQLIASQQEQNQLLREQMAQTNQMLQAFMASQMNGGTEEKKAPQIPKVK